MVSYRVALPIVRSWTTRSTYNFVSLLISSPLIHASAHAVAKDPTRMTLERLHARVSQTYNPSSDIRFDFSAVVALCLSSGISPSLASSIGDQIMRHLTSKNANVIGLRATKVYSPTTDNHFWIMLDWRTEMNTDVLAIFRNVSPNDPDSTSNWLMHFGYGKRFKGVSDRCWTTTLISWNVSSLGYLKSLFGGARHILGILELSVKDASTLREPQSNGSVKEYISSCKHVTNSEEQRDMPSSSARTL